MVIFSQWFDIQKGYSKTRDYLEKSDFSVIADAHAHPSMRGGVCVGGGGRGAGYVFLQSRFEDGRSKFQPWPPGL